MISPGRIEAAFRDACAEELAAMKPGNVHARAPGHGMTVDDFLLSAEAAAPLLCAPGARLGTRIFDAVAATRARVGQNTNLGIVLLCAPLAMAAERRDIDLRKSVATVIEASDLGDAEAVFRAIALANPGGLGDAARHDVREPARASLGEAMGEARDRDGIARQWWNGFADIFGLGLSAYAGARSRGRSGAWAAAETYLTFLSTFPDSHVTRKHGEAVAEAVRREAAPFLDLVMRLASPDDAQASPEDADASPGSAQASPDDVMKEMLRWDAALKVRRVNPGTSADLTVATAFAWRLERLLREIAVDG